MLYKNTKVKVRSPDGDTDYFDIVAGVLQGDTLAPYPFRLRASNVHRFRLKKRGFTMSKERSRRQPMQNIMDADCFDDIALLANAPAQAESLLQ